MGGLYRALGKIGAIILAATVLSSVILISAKMIVKKYFDDVTAHTALVTAKTQSYNDRVKKINAALSETNKLQDAFNQWSFLVEDLSGITPAGLTLSSVKADGAAGTIAIRGKAGLREDILKFKDNLGRSQYIKDVDFPIRNMLERENIDFDLSGKLIMPIIMRKQ